MTASLSMSSSEYQMLHYSSGCPMNLSRQFHVELYRNSTSKIPWQLNPWGATEQQDGHHRKYTEISLSMRHLSRLRRRLDVVLKNSLEKEKDRDKGDIVEALRCIAENLIWGDQNNPQVM